MIFHKDKLTIKLFHSRREMGIAAASDVAAKIKEMLRNKKNINIIFGSAPSQDDFLSALSTCDIEWEKINAFHMDEYIGLDINAPQRLGYYLKTNYLKTSHSSRSFISEILHPANRMKKKRSDTPLC
jgi:glucosamine-6-phosphate deaminase